ncbi:Alcohol dehydrogenase GroES-like domain-containing protein [Coniochaeta hoffmannii]|uniref:Alcohol dehydrogenase GroES-like domain-containing protein n=1 Tax=Coniochaeta hoffmannii TaxID=91930 RepID=A0AA38S9G1_9PEZI|nr:Alcohol dehydrogenase GroES-like domain-containing protein [Coniochaeta hoffmannii]
MAATQGLPSQMKAAHLREYNKPYELVTVDVPKIKDNELLVELRAAGFCHSDLQVIHGQFGTKLPIIPSHEPAGVIVQVGSRCGGSWKVGDRVGVLNFKNACGQRETAGFQHDGAFAQYLAADPETTVLLPASLSFEQAAPLMCAGATVWGALEKATADLEPAATVAIVGIGGLGHLGLQFAKSLGFTTIALDSRQAGRDLAAEVPDGLGPDLVVDSTSEDAAEKILAFTKGEGVAAAVVCTDSIAANTWTLRLLRVGGVMVPLGLPPDRWQFDADVLVYRELVIRGNYVASAESTRRMMEAVARRGVRSHVTTVELDDVPGIVDVYQDKNFRGRLVVKIC